MKSAPVPSSSVMVSASDTAKTLERYAPMAALPLALPGTAPAPRPGCHARMPFIRGRGESSFLPVREDNLLWRRFSHPGAQQLFKILAAFGAEYG